MANVKNFGLVGVGSTVQFGKGNSTLSAATTTALRADGTAAFILPSGTNAQQPLATIGAGAIRYNSDGTTMEYSNGTSWVALATGGAAVTSVNGTAGRITSSNTGAGSTTIDIAATYAGQTSITTLGTVTTGTWNGTTIAVANGGTGATSLTTNGVVFGNGTSTVGVTAAGTQYQVLQAGSGGVPEFGAVALNQAAAVTGVLPVANGGTGLDTSGATNGQILIGNGTGLVLNTITGGTGVTVTNGAGSITIDIDNTEVVTSVASSGGTITVSPGTGAVDVSLPNVGTSVTLDFVKITTDAQGRVSATTDVVTADITALVDATYVNVSGDTMTGTLNMGNFYVTMNNAPVSDTQAANKAYVDSVAAGLSWKNAVQAATVPADGAIPGFSAGTITIPNNNATFFPNAAAPAVVDGVTFAVNGRLLVKNQTTTAQNGIYVVTNAGVQGTTDAVLVRASDMDAAGDFYGATVFVTNGTVNDNTGWTQTEIVTTVNTDPVLWVQFSGSNTYTWGTGLSQSGNTINVNLGAGITQLPGDEVGIDLYDSANNPLILTLNGTTRDNAGPGPTAGAKLGLLLDGSSLSMGSGGLRVAAGGVDLTSMVTGILPPANGGTGVANASTITVGGNFSTIGAYTADFTMTGNTAVTFPTSGTLATVGGTVASFSTGTTGLLANGNANTPETGAVTLSGILDVDNGGTGLATVTAGRILYGDGINPLATSAVFSFDGTDTLTIGSATIEGASGGDTTITAGGTSDINLNPGTGGSVVVGPSASPGLISSDTNQNLTVQASGTGLLTLTSGGDTTMVLPSGTGSKVTVSGPTAADYATGLANEDLVNKYYVDTVAGSVTGDVKAVKATISLASTGSFNIGSALPAGATILQVKVNVTSADTGTGTLVVGKSGGNEYMTASENDTQTVGMYIAEDMVTEAGSVTVQATVGGTPAGAGSATIVVTYQLA